ncbi:MAG: hypothetical protein M9938_09780 [Solirubrobacterales bacterium]|nr:hypothetical protein [Solirubrobacterales bacterium]
MSSTTPQAAIRPVLLILLALCALSLAGLGLAVRDAGAVTSLPLYSNSMRSPDAVDKIRQFGSKANCSRKGSTKSLRVEVGKRTRECFYNIPVVGRDLQAAITARLFVQTPKKVARRTWVAVNLRQAADGSRYQFAVLPWTGQYSLRKKLVDGKIKYLKFGKNRSVVRKMGEANRITFRAYNGVDRLKPSTARLVGIVNGKRLAVFDDHHGYKLEGRDTTISIGSKDGARGARGSFVSADVKMPDPF